jgi:hypothetical protein
MFVCIAIARGINSNQLGTERRGAMLPWRSKHIHVHVGNNWFQIRASLLFTNRIQSKSRLYWNTQRDGKPNYDISAPLDGANSSRYHRLSPRAWERSRPVGQRRLVPVEKT